MWKILFLLASQILSTLTRDCLNVEYVNENCVHMLHQTIANHTVLNKEQKDGSPKKVVLTSHGSVKEEELNENQVCSKKFLTLF